LKRFIGATEKELMTNLKVVIMSHWFPALLRFSNELSTGLGKISNDIGCPKHLRPDLKNRVFKKQGCYTK